MKHVIFYLLSKRSTRRGGGEMTQGDEEDMKECYVPSLRHRHCSLPVSPLGHTQFNTHLAPGYWTHFAQPADRWHVRVSILELSILIHHFVWSVKYQKCSLRFSVTVRCAAKLQELQLANLLLTSVSNVKRLSCLQCSSPWMQVCSIQLWSRPCDALWSQVSQHTQSDCFFFSGCS